MNPFAEDCLIYLRIKTSDNQVAFIQCLDHISQWCLHRQITINLSKPSYTHITHKRSISPFQYQIEIGHTELNKVETFKYLGVTISQNGKWKSHIIISCATAYRKLCALRRKLKYANTVAKLTPYKALLRLTREYASFVLRRKIAGLKFLFRMFRDQLKIYPDVYLKHVTTRSARLNHSKSLQSTFSRIYVITYIFILLKQ